MISVVVTSHRESLLIHRTLKSVYDSIERAEQANIPCELIVVLDRSDDETRRYVDRFPIQRHRTVEVDFGDPGLARNAGAQKATGKYVAYLDGDDLFCPQWLTSAYKYAENSRVPRLVLHPEYNAYFESINCLVQYGGCPKPGFSPLGLAIVNYWTSIIFLKRAMLADAAFPGLDPASGFGYEDWHVVAEQIGLGAEVHTVPGTCNFVRRKHFNSVLTRHSQSKALLPPSRLLDPITIAQQQQTSLTAPQKLHGVPKLKRELKRVFRQIVPRRLSDAFLKPETPTVADQPSFVVEACQAVHAIEPKIYPSAEQFSAVHYPMKAGLAAAEQYRLLCQSCTRRPTHVFLVPWLKTGGSDLETLNYIEAVFKASDKNRVAVIATLNSDSPWASRLPNDVSFIPFGHICRDIPANLHAQLLGTFLIQLQPRVIHNMNSPEGYLAFRDHGAALQSQSRLFASVFCEDITKEGRIVGYAFDQLPDCFRYLSGVFADNGRILKVLSEYFGFAKDKLLLHYQPIAANESKPKTPADRLSVLWAGRLDRQKRPDLLKKIAEGLKKTAIDFTVYGSSLLEKSEEPNQWSLPNVAYRGAFDGFESLPAETFDVLLHTAQWEGLPNVLLEAMSRGMTVVAAGVGGVPELIQDGVNGVCVTPFDDVGAFCKALRTLQSDRAKLSRLAAAGKQTVAARHSWTAFQRTVAAAPGYLTAPSTKSAGKRTGSKRVAA
jgi:glycosyltransferase involved in cell wall biosynthesis